MSWIAGLEGFRAEDLDLEFRASDDIEPRSAKHSSTQVL